MTVTVKGYVSQFSEPQVFQGFKYELFRKAYMEAKSGHILANLCQTCLYNKHSHEFQFLERFTRKRETGFVNKIFQAEQTGVHNSTNYFCFEE